MNNDNLHLSSDKGMCRYLLFLIVAMLTCFQQAQALTFVDQRIKVKASWENNRLIVYQLKYRDSGKKRDHGRISGTISQLDKSRHHFKLGPYLIHWNTKTLFQLASKQLDEGYVVRVTGIYKDKDSFEATAIQSETAQLAANSLSIIGSVSAVQKQLNKLTPFVLLGQKLYIPNKLISPAYQLTRKQDDKRPSEQTVLSLFGRPLTIGGEIGVTPRYRKNFNLDSEKNRDRVRLDNEAQLELLYPWSSNLAFFESQLVYEQDLYRGSNRTTRGNAELKRGESWLFLSDILQTDLSLQIGRQNFRESREWWWDQDLDAIRLFYYQPAISFQIAIAEQFFPVSTLDTGVDPRDKNVLRVLSNFSWRWSSSHHTELFFMYQYDHSEQENVADQLSDKQLDGIDGNLLWTGIRFQNRFKNKNLGSLESWFDGAWVKGQERRIKYTETITKDIFRVESIQDNNLEGWALDFGVTWVAPVDWEPSVIVGYAIGTKDFRQTGLQDNNDRFQSVSRFRYYGELLRPELSNLQILTAGISLPILQNSSITALYHYYSQVDAQSSFLKGRINASPNGLSAEIGEEWDLIIAAEEWKHWELELVTAVFKAGSAYGKKSGHMAFNTVLKVNYNF